MTTLCVIAGRVYQCEFDGKTRLIYDAKTKDQVSSTGRITLANRLVKMKIGDTLTVFDKPYKALSAVLSSDGIWTTYDLTETRREA